VEEDAKDVASRAGVKLTFAIGYRITKKQIQDVLQRLEMGGQPQYFCLNDLTIFLSECSQRVQITTSGAFATLICVSIVSQWIEK